MALGMKTQSQPLCNTADGLRQCEDMIRFLSDIYTSIAGLSVRNGFNSGKSMSSAIKASQDWPESFLEGMRYQLRRMLTNLLDRLSPTTSSARLKVSICLKTCTSSAAVGTGPRLFLCLFISTDESPSTHSSL